VAIAADSDDHRLASLLAAAGRALAIADDDAVDDYAERFADDESANEMQSPPAVRRAVGLARALQAGALSAVSLPVPRDLSGLKGVLVAHAALVTGRHSAAVALREVLRELHPAALRAYPDPADPVPLAILDALPGPHSLNGGATSERGRDSAATDAIVANLTGSGIADAATVEEAITALRVAIAETPRRSVADKASNAAIAETIRHAVAAVRACDAACQALVASLAERLTEPSTTRSGGGHRAANAGPEHGAQRSDAPAGRRAARQPAGPTPAPAGRRSRSQERSQPAAERTPASARPTASPPAPLPAAPGFNAPPLAPAASAAPAGSPPPAAPVSPPVAPVSPPAWVTGTGSNRPVSAPPPPPPGITPIASGQRAPAADAGEPFRPTRAASAQASGSGRHAPREQAASTPSPRAMRAAEDRQSVAAAVESRSEALRAIRRRSADRAGGRDAGSPQNAGATRESVTAAMERGGARSGRRAAQNGDADRWIDDGAPAARYSATDYTVPVPTPRPDRPAPGARANWPLTSTSDDLSKDATALPGIGSAGYPSELDAPTGTAERISALAGGRVTPPWQADDLPPEPPALRLVEPPPLADRALREDRPEDRDGESRPASVSLDLPAPERGLDTPPLRLVGRNGSDSDDSDWSEATKSRRDGSGRADPLGSTDDDGDGDLLIFAQMKSAWFVGRGEEGPPDWDSIADFGWKAAEQASRPTVGAATSAGLPKRVPQANLVPGSPLSTPDRPLRIVRDAASIAAHTSGYFQGWRRGQEINGYAVGGRPGRESARGWDFSRDTGSREDEDYTYRRSHAR
jgi:hypothetical protein